MAVLGRNLRFFLRFAEFVCATVVLGLTCYFLNFWDRWRVGPKGSEIYVVVLSLLSTLLSIFCMISTAVISPQGFNLHLPFIFDLVASGLWFVAFGLFVSYLNDIQACGAVFQWSDIEGGGFCGKWKADLAFAFISAMLWLMSCGCGFYTYRLQAIKDAANAAAKLAAAEEKLKPKPRPPPPPPPQFPVPCSQPTDPYAAAWQEWKMKTWQEYYAAR